MSTNASRSTSVTSVTSVTSNLSRRALLASVAAASVGAAGLARAGQPDDKASDNKKRPAPANDDAMPQPAGFYPIKVGSIVGAALSDGIAPNPVSPHPMFATEATKEQADAALKEACLPSDRFVFYFNGLYLRLGSDHVLIDAGGGNTMGPAFGKLEDNLRAAGVDPDSINAIILTHAHGDHFGGLLNEAGAPRFRNARLIVNKSEHDFWMGAAPDLSGLRMPDDTKAGFIAGAKKHLEAFKGKTELVSAGDRLFGDALELLDGRGHTPGHMPVVIRSGNEQLLNLADTAHHHVLQFKNPAWTVAFDADHKVAVTTRKKIFAQAAGDRMRVLGYHMPWPGVGHIREIPGGFEWVAQPWGM